MRPVSGLQSLLAPLPWGGRWTNRIRSHEHHPRARPHCPHAGRRRGDRRPGGALGLARRRGTAEGHGGGVTRAVRPNVLNLILKSPAIRGALCLESAWITLRKFVFPTVPGPGTVRARMDLTFLFLE